MSGPDRAEPRMTRDWVLMVRDRAANPKLSVARFDTIAVCDELLAWMGPEDLVLTHEVSR